MKKVNFKSLGSYLLVFFACAFFVDLAAADPVDATETVKLPAQTHVGSSYPVEISFKNNLPFTLSYIKVETKLSPQGNTLAAKQPSNNCINVSSGGICTFKTDIAIPQLGLNTLFLTMLYPGRSIKLPEQSTTSVPPVPPPPENFMAVGDKLPSAGVEFTSPDGITWVERALPANVQSLTKSFWNGSLWVAVGIKVANGGIIITSPDGLVWTERTIPPAADVESLRNVTWNGNLWVAVGRTNGDSAVILTSPDGITWTQQVLMPAIPGLLSDIAWNGSQFVAVGRRTPIAPIILTSANGTNWTEETVPPPFDINVSLSGIASNGVIWTAVGGGAPGAAVLTSPDGVTWTAQPVPASIAGFSGISWNSSIWVAVGTGGGLCRVATSSDASIWTEHIITPSVSGFLFDVIWKDNIWVTVGRKSPNGGVILSSPDGISWTERSVPVPTNQLLGISVGTVGS